MKLRPALPLSQVVTFHRYHVELRVHREPRGEAELPKRMADRIVTGCAARGPLRTTKLGMSWSVRPKSRNSTIARALRPRRSLAHMV